MPLLTTDCKGTKALSVLGLKAEAVGSDTKKLARKGGASLTKLFRVSS
jgi:hypothetical protein